MRARSLAGLDAGAMRSKIPNLSMAMVSCGRAVVLVIYINFSLSCFPLPACLTTIAISPSFDALQVGSWSTPAQLLLAFVCMNSSVVAMRVVLVGLIEERNRFLSHAIRVACMRQPGALVKDSTSHAGASSNESAPLAPVVAVLGLAHIYGVRQLLSEMAEETSDTCA